MAALESLNTSFEVNIISSRKRKRKFNNIEQQRNDIPKKHENNSCFINAAFSSTPKNILVKRRVQSKTNHTVFPNVGLEVKSIAEIGKPNEQLNNILQNPFEVIRKPPKKKRNNEGIACFENPGLNLELPEKLFNPYEVVREIIPKNNSNCFSNPALNLKVQDVSVLCNPFEVHRETSSTNTQKLQEKAEDNVISLNTFKIKTEAHVVQEVLTPKPCRLRLGVPFVPTVGCRIDFENISMSQLTPTKLLAEKLVFSPVSKAKTSLSSIEEETTMDIGKELDRYQLELENSINEAKLRKTDVHQECILVSPSDASYHNHFVNNEKSEYTQKLCVITEDGENEENTEYITKQKGLLHKVWEEKKENAKKYGKDDIKKKYQEADTSEVVETDNLDELYGISSDEDFLDLENSAPFVRAYTKPHAANTELMVSKESFQSHKFEKTGESNDQNKKSMNVKNIIRKSVRKLMQHQQAETKLDSMENVEKIKNNGFFNTIRQSLRRKPTKAFSDDHVNKKSEISIIDHTERTTKLKSIALETEYIKIEDLTNEKKYNLRNSIRKSTHNVRNQIFKTVLHKKCEEYDFNK